MFKDFKSMNVYFRLSLQGNQENRVVVYDRKVVDYINFILRAGDIADCPPEKVNMLFYDF